jgi:hypothetical protein
MAVSLSDRERSLRATTVTIGREPSAKRWLAKSEAPKAAGVHGEHFLGRLFRYLEAKAERKISRGLRRQPPASELMPPSVPPGVQAMFG